MSSRSPSLLAIAGVLAASAAHAAPAPPPKRTPPAYDGRPEAPPSAEDVVRGVARAILFPLRIVVDYGLRKPTGFLVRTFEDSRTVRRVFRYLFLGSPAPTLSIYPIAFYDFGFQSSIGLRMAWVRDFATPGSSFYVKTAFGGLNWRRADTTTRIALPTGAWFTADLLLRRRPDQIFHGVGSRSSEAARARYTVSRSALTVGLGWPVLSAYAGLASVGATESRFQNEASIEQQVDAGRIAELPTGYNQLLLLERAGVRIGLDTRRVRSASGARLDAVIERARERDLGAWTRIDATLGGALRLDAVGEYKLDLRLRVELIEPDAGTEVPFMELATIGGSRDLRGFASGRGRDASAAALTLDYQWPVAAWLDATLYAGAGNVFGPRLSGFYAGKLRGSLGTGLALTGLSRARQVELWTAVGTDPFDEGLNVASFRLVLGYSYDY